MSLEQIDQAVSDLREQATAHAINRALCLYEGWTEEPLHGGGMGLFPPGIHINQRPSEFTASRDLCGKILETLSTREMCRYQHALRDLLGLAWFAGAEMLRAKPRQQAEALVLALKLPLCLSSLPSR